MKNFALLITKISSSTKTNEKQQAIADYFSLASEEDKIYSLALLIGWRPKRIINSTKLHIWSAEEANIPLWLFEESYHNVGDLAETIALILPEHNNISERTLKEWIDHLMSLYNLEDQGKKEVILEAWHELSTNERYVFNKLITGNFRIGVSQALTVNALSKLYKTDPQIITHRISGNWSPLKITFEELISGDHVNTDNSKPYPFYLAYAIEGKVEDLGKPDEWQAEWKWDGIRGQIIKRNDHLFVWSRGEDLITEKFPEYDIFKNLLPDGTVLDGEIICFADGKPLPFNILQTRIGRKNITKKILLEAPVAFILYDILEWSGEDIRKKTLKERRFILEDLHKKINNPVLQISPVAYFTTWEELSHLQKQSRLNASEGLMLKAKNSIYQAGRKRGDWWKWKVDPLSIDCVMVAAQKGHGRRANLYTDYTFAVRNGKELVTFTKAYSGLTDKEFTEVDAFVKKNIIEKFGPVRTVKPELVFEIGFEGIAESKRHKSGVALRFPRILRWRKDKNSDEINTLDDLQSILKNFV